jgi:hypothetical protein
MTSHTWPYGTSADMLGMCGEVPHVYRYRFYTGPRKSTCLDSIGCASNWTRRVLLGQSRTHGVNGFCLASVLLGITSGYCLRV